MSEGPEAVAVLLSGGVKGEILFFRVKSGTKIAATITECPAGKHGFHIHKAGDLRGEGCQGACDHWHKGPPASHGGPPNSKHKEQRHTGDLGNIDFPVGATKWEQNYFLRGVHPSELLGRSVIVHADPDDLGKGDFEDSKTTGHSGKRISCAIIGRAQGCFSAPSPPKTRRRSRSRHHQKD